MIEFRVKNEEALRRFVEVNAEPFATVTRERTLKKLPDCNGNIVVIKSSATIKQPDGKIFYVWYENQKQ